MEAGIYFSTEFNAVPTLSQMRDDLRRDSNSLKNRLLSISEDAQFVTLAHQVLANDLCLFCNLRCGLWYTPIPKPAKCYFKSTDGHYRKWAFSFARLNTHVLLYAYLHGGAFIVDSTRKGKRMPDALSKTVPIWASVFSTALRIQLLTHVERSLLNKEEPSKSLELHESCTVRETDCFDKIVLPPWIMPSERLSIEKKQASWVNMLVQSHSSLLDSCLQKLGVLGDLPSTECDRCEQCDRYSSQSILQYLFEKVPVLRCVFVHRGADIYEIAEAEKERKEGIPVFCVSASRTDGEDVDQRKGWSYVQGAGDDEEGWALGLTPASFFTLADPQFDKQLLNPKIRQYAGVFESKALTQLSSLEVVETVEAIVEAGNLHISKEGEDHSLEVYDVSENVSFASSPLCYEGESKRSACVEVPDGYAVHPVVQYAYDRWHNLHSDSESPEVCPSALQGYDVVLFLKSHLLAGDSASCSKCTKSYLVSKKALKKLCKGRRKWSKDTTGQVLETRTEYGCHCEVNVCISPQSSDRETKEKRHPQIVWSSVIHSREYEGKDSLYISLLGTLHRLNNAEGSHLPMLPADARILVLNVEPREKARFIHDSTLRDGLSHALCIGIGMHIYQLVRQQIVSTLAGEKVREFVTASALHERKSSVSSEMRLLKTMMVEAFNRYVAEVHPQQEGKGNGSHTQANCTQCLACPLLLPSRKQRKQIFKAISSMVMPRISTKM